jgi:hypothetical protein
MNLKAVGSLNPVLVMSVAVETSSVNTVAVVI